MKSFLNELSQNFKNLKNDPTFADIKIRNCDQGKVILFDKPNITPELFKILISYIYNGNIVLTGVKFSDIIFLLCGACDLQLKELCDYIEDKIVGQKDLVIENIFLIYQIELFEFAKLSALCKAKWINEVSNLDQNTFYTFNLLQRASKHGLTSKVFHKRCDSKGPTIVIMRVKNTGEILAFGRNDLKICGVSNANEKSRCKKLDYEKSIRENREFFSIEDYKSTLISIINNGKGSERIENQGYLDKCDCYRLGKQKINPNFKAVEFKKFNDYYFNFYDARSIKGALDSLLNIVTPKTNVL
ncbi:hypothetical protein C2G38_2247477 [Gigaspora rosea]|uniref:BTB domain-containing protein n=1 Tax=Gigaspora rosea TaxID=44941 RepID=A0A397V6X2_9GLOM|nr:hypothetical protein C2G38_2247477 [Gigaspora rosea]